MSRLYLVLVIIVVLFSCSDDFFPDEEGVVRICGISNMEIAIGDCKEDFTYGIELDFLAANAENETFDLFVRGDELLDSYSLRDLPLKIDNFQPSGQEFDFIKICITDNPTCCAEIEFMPPNCMETDTSTTAMEDCMINSLVVETGDCSSDSTYLVEINFDPANAGNESFDVFLRNEELLGNYGLDQLPLRLEDFKPSGQTEDFIKICINDNPDCCAEIEFKPPVCMESDTTTTTVEECVINLLAVETGDCSSDSTYLVELNFFPPEVSSESFDVFTRNDELIGSYGLDQLPLRLDDFKPSGQAEDYIKVCITDMPNCCAEVEFQSPTCLVMDTMVTEEICEIRELIIDAGECTSDSTYVLEINFGHTNTSNESFDLFIRGEQLIDFFPLTDLPIRLDSFPTSGLEFDFIKICINDDPDCCQEMEFMPPDCIQ